MLFFRFQPSLRRFKAFHPGALLLCNGMRMTLQICRQSTFAPDDSIRCRVPSGFMSCLRALIVTNSRSVHSYVCEWRASMTRPECRLLSRTYMAKWMISHIFAHALLSVLLQFLGNSRHYRYEYTTPLMYGAGSVRSLFLSLSSSGRRR